MANVIVTQTINKVSWSVDQTSYGKALKQIRSLKTEWEKTGKAFSQPKSDPAAALKRSAIEVRLVNKRLQQTQRSEAAKTTSHNIAMAKKESRAREAIAKRENARRVQAVRGITSKDPELSRMRQFYQQQQKLNKNTTTYGTNPTISAARQAALREELARRTRSGNAGGMVGDGTGGYRPGSQENMQRGTQRIQRERSKEEIRAREKAARDQAREDARYSKYLAGKESTVSNASVRLRAKYGDNYSGKLKGFDDLKERFLNSNTMKSSNFRAELAAMESQLKSANQGALTFSDGLKSLRRTLISVTAAYSAFNAGAKVLQAGQFFQGMEATMLMVSDNSVEAGKRMQFVQDQAYRLGLDLKIASQGYTQMAIAADGVLSKSQNDNLFKSFSEYATALQVDPVKYQRGITAIQQMMGKGQIMAEELKQQLAEGIPGSLQVFLKATQEAFGDSSIDIAKLMDMMKNGELTASKILPLVGKYYAEAANKGGALDKALQGNRVAMQRLQQTWFRFQNEIFKSGFGEEMTQMFNNLAQMMDQSGPLAQALGDLAGGFVDAFDDIFTTVYNTFVMIDAVLQRYIPVFRRNGEEMGSAFKWVGWALGAGLFATSLWRVFGILSKIAGLSGSLKFLGALFGEGAVTSAPTTPGKTPTPKPTGVNKVATWLKTGGRFAGILSILGLGSEINDRYNPLSDFNTQRGDTFNQIGDSIRNQEQGETTIANWWNGLWSKHQQDRLTYLQNQGMTPTSGSQQAPMVIPTEPVSGEIKITVDAGAMKDMIDQQIEAANMGNINLLLGVPE